LLSPEELNFFKNVILFEEFVKELSAVMQVQSLSSKLEINYVDD